MIIKKTRIEKWLNKIEEKKLSKAAQKECLLMLKRYCDLIHKLTQMETRTRTC